jgi:hypothetical protein
VWVHAFGSYLLTSAFLGSIIEWSKLGTSVTLYELKQETAILYRMCSSFNPPNSQTALLRDISPLVLQHMVRPIHQYQKRRWRRRMQIWLVWL